MMFDFSFKGLPWNIVFAPGALGLLGNHLDSLGYSRALVLTTAGQKAKGQHILELLGDKGVGIFSQARMHVPLECLEAAKALATQVRADCTIGFGGGSTTGLGKALAVEADLPNIVIPTTYAGSEMTNIWAVTDAGRKVTARHDKALPTLTVYDPQLTVDLPVSVSMASGFNALAQAAVNVATNKPNPMAAALGKEAVRNLVEALPQIKRTPGDLEARSSALYGACLAGAALGTGKTGIHHKLCHVLGGAFNTPHAETHGILLPYSVAYNAAAAYEGTRALAGCLGHDDAPAGLYQLGRQLGIPGSLQDIGISERDLDKVAELVLEKAFDNPAAVTLQGVRTLLQDAFAGNPP